MLRRIVICCIAFGIAGSATFGEDTPPSIHVDWDDIGGEPPVEGTNYLIFGALSAFPDIQLLTPQDTYRIWSTDSDNPDGIGDIGKIYTGGGFIFGVTIVSDTGGPGARHIKEIVLNPNGLASDSSLVLGGWITGNFLDELTVKQSNTGANGKVNLTIEGNSSALMTIPRLIQLVIDGDLSNKIDVTDEVKGAGLTISGNVTATGEIEIADFVTGNITIGAPGKQFAGILDLENGVPSGITVEVKSDLTSAASVDLNSQAVAGTLKFSGDNAADIISGGAVTGTVTLAAGSANSYSGDATFASVAAGGDIETTSDAELSGTLTVTDDVDGDISIDGDLSGSLTVDGALAGVGRIITATSMECSGAIRVGKQADELTLIQCAGGLTSTGTIEINTSRGGFDADGTIRVGPANTPFPLPGITYDGCIRIYDQDPGIGGGGMNGTISVVGCHATSNDLNICIDGRKLGTIDIVQTDCPNQVGWSCGTCP